jgi:hypothetical protein
LVVEEKYNPVRRLMTRGKEKGYLLYDEAGDEMPDALSPADEVD